MKGGTVPKSAMRLVIFEEEGGFVAVCLEHYIGAQGHDMKQVQQRLKTAYRAELDRTLADTGEPFSGIPPAPQRYHRMWDTPGVTRGHIHSADDTQQELQLAA